MNKIALLLFFIPVFSFSQSESKWEAHLGGLISQVSGDGYTGFMKLGINAGLGGIFPLDNKGHFVSYQLNYIQKGAKDYRNEKAGDYSDYTLSLDYLELPISYLFPLWGVYFDVGIAPSYRFGFKQINNGIQGTRPPNLSIIELGLSAGVNFEINKHWVFSARYLNSLTPMQSSIAPITYWFNQGGMHQMIALQLQYFFSSSMFTWNLESKKEGGE